MADDFHEELGAAHDALNRMRRANKRGSGCRLTAEMIAALSCTSLGSMWAEDDPRTPSTPPRDEQKERE